MDPVQPCDGTHAQDARNDARRVLGRLTTEDLNVLVLTMDELGDNASSIYDVAYDVLSRRDDLA